MRSWLSRLSNGLLNAALAIVGLGVLVLLYSLVTRTTMQTPDPTRASDSTHLVGEIIQVEVRNGCGIDGLAAQTTQYLRDQGFDVVDVGNDQPFDQQQSLVIDRVGDPASARKVARALGLPQDRVQTDVQRDLFLDATVVIGHDYQTMRPFR
jgi:hypothetical protein